MSAADESFWMPFPEADDKAHPLAVTVYLTVYDPPHRDEAEWAAQDTRYEQAVVDAIEAANIQGVVSVDEVESTRR